MESGERFWRDHIERRVAPVIDGSASAKEYLRKFAPANIEPLRMATPEEEASIGALIDVRSAIAALEKQEAELANRIKMAIGEADGLQSTLGKVTWKLSKDAEVVDWQGVAKALNADQSLIKRFTEIRPGTRRFLLPKLNK
jgi:predicted phage-related endonuclease